MRACGNRDPTANVDSMTSQTIKARPCPPDPCLIAQSALSDIQRAANPSTGKPLTAVAALRKAVKARLEAAETLVPDLARAYRNEAKLIEVRRVFLSKT